MTKVIKVKFEKLESIKISDVLLICNTSLEIFNEEFNRTIRIKDDLFTYEVKLLRGDDEVKLTDEESSDSEDEDEVAKKFRIETNVFNFETPLCRALKEFNYLLEIEPDLLTEDIEPFNYKNGCSEWPTYSWRDDGFYNGGNLHGAYIVGNALRYQDFEWYEALKDGKLKEETLKNKAIMEGIIKDEDNESSNEDKERRELFDDHERPVCNIRRFEMIKYSFRQDEEYVAVKENEYDDLKSTSEDACRTYQEIFRMMDEGWKKDDELSEKELKQVEADDQAIRTILLGLPEDIYAAVDSCETAQEIWFTSTDGESIESYYHCFSKLMNDFKRNKHFPEKIASNLKFLNNLQPEWSRHVTIVHQTKDLHTTNYTQLYDFLKYNQKEVNDLRAKRLVKTHDPLTLMENSNNPFNYPVFHQD
ncbi:hypothetical protein Tco_1053608 [Tanacetum coccineum]|uniref:Uncharacterized protein n=1 Tax=Tanacetum coccineum TaxID=301880 RepID=A0ABQ5GUE1_9ASTR